MINKEIKMDKLWKKKLTKSHSHRTNQKNRNKRNLKRIVKLMYKHLEDLI